MLLDKMTFTEKLQFGCAVCRIGCYMIWRKLCCKKPDVPRPEFQVICLGLSGAGKSTLLTLLCGEEPDSIEQPTAGFSIKVVRLDDCILHVKEIGGGEKVRPFWHHYYAGAQGVIFVVNSSSSDEELEQARDTLYKCLAHPALHGLPCLIIANHQDLSEARPEAKILDILELEDACSNREWVLVMGSKTNIGKLRDDFSKYTNFLLRSLGEEHGQNGPQQSTTSLEMEENMI